VNRTDRLLAILLELQRRGGTRAQDLADHFEVSLRTIYRDVQALSETGVPIMATPGRGYALMEGYFLPPIALTASEAALLVLGGEFVRERVDPELRRAADQALAKLAAVLPPARRDEVARWRRELHFLSLRPPGDEERLTLLRNAIQERRVLRIDYWAYRRPGSETREVEPSGLVHLGETWHLAGYCRARQAPRLFRLDRIQAVETLDETFQLGPRHQVGPDPAGEDDADRAPEAQVRFDRDVERWVRERNLYLFRREEVDADGTRFVYALRDEAVLTRWLLGWGPTVEVLSPPHLRDRLADEARRIVRKHTARMLSAAPS
jgi:predicted DNA-binding transcriptional regulator YafY